jgi:hypothetical protein
MIEELLVINIAALLGLGGVTISISVIVLRKARGYVELAEKRMEALREGQARLARAMSRGQQSLQEGAVRDRQSLSEEERRNQARQEIEKRIAQLQQQLRELQEAQEDLQVREEAYAARHEKTLADSPRDWMMGQAGPVQARSSAEEPQTPKKTSRDEVGCLARWHLHPDDDAGAFGERSKGHNRPAQMFREHYDRYLENYEGYVKLAERLCAGVEEEGGSPAEQDWEGRLRRLNDGIRRTTSRLDILEQYNPELATDDRVSRRADIARKYAEFERCLQEVERF